MQKSFIIILILFLFSCSSTTDTANKNKTSNVETNKIKGKDTKEKDKIEHIKALNARGFYMNQYGDVNYFGERVCNNVELQSHRGHVKYPENSISSIAVGIENGFDVIEIDVMPNADDTWVVHHDKKTGRATGTIDNKQRKISRTKDKDMGYIVHRNMETGALLNITIPTARDAFFIFSSYSNKNQYLNIEIKGNWYKSSLEKIEYLAFSLIKSKRYFFSSSEFENLEKIREINPSIRLNYINPVNFTSLQVEKNKIKKGSENDPIYEREKRKRGYDYSPQDEEKARKVYNKRIKTVDFDYMNKRIGPNFSTSTDIRSFASSYDSKVKQTFKNKGVKSSTYSINGQKYHEDMLNKIPKKYWPDSVIIDSSVYGFCSQFGLPNKKTFTSNNEIANGIYNLPIDVDLERISQLKTYENSGLYPAVGGILKPYNKVEKKQARRLTVGKKQKEENFELATGMAIEVELRNEN
jgi:glycerophosphoryl diester phosphodiesterase